MLKCTIIISQDAITNKASIITALNNKANNDNTYTIKAK